jgi:hypothetical protein
VAHPKFSGTKDRSLITIGVTAALLSVPLAAPIVAAAADSPFQALGLKESQPLSLRPVTRRVAVVDKAVKPLVDPKGDTVVDRAGAVLDPVTGKLIDPVTGAVIPSETPADSPAARPASKTAKSRVESPREPVSPASALSAESLTPSQPAGTLVAPADATVVNVVDEVLGASSDSPLHPVTSLLGDANLLGNDAGGSSSNEDSEPEPARHGEVSRTTPAPDDDVDARTVGPAGDSDVVEVQPDARSSSTSVGGASGVPHLLGVSTLSGLYSSQSYFSQEDLRAPEVSTPAEPADAPSAVSGGLVASERRPTVGRVTATSLPDILDETPSWLVSTASGLLLVIGGASVVYGTRRFRRRTAD